jgi:catecholate siderophore receptor
MTCIFIIVKGSMYLIRFLVSSVAVFVLLFCSVSGVSADVPECVIKGRVVDQNGAAVAGSNIELLTGSSLAASVKANDDGEFTITTVPGDYALKVTASGFVAHEQSLTICPGDNSTLELVLEIEPTTAEVNITDGGAYQVGTLSSATKTFTALSDIPQAISLTTRQQIADQNMTSIGDVVRYQPGITAHQGENNRDQIVIRGQSSSADFFVNGVRDDVQYYRDLYNLDRVETLRGPNALVFGRGGGGGVINRVTKEADFTPSSVFTLEGGSYNNVRATFDLNVPIKRRFAVRANGVAEYSGSFRRDVSLKRYGFSPTMTFDPDEKTHITAGFEIFRDRRTADRGITSYQGRPADVDISTYYGNPDDSRVRANANLFTASIDRQFGKLLFRDRIMYGDYDRFYQNYVPGASNASASLVTLSAYNNSTRRKNLFNQTDLIYYAETAGIKHTLLGGVEMGRQQTRNFRNTGYFNNSSTSILVDFDDPQTNIPVTFRQSATDADNRVNVSLAAAYIQDQIVLNRFVQLIAGARFDYFDLKFFNNRSASDLRRTDRLVSPRFGVVVKPVGQLSLYGSYSVSQLPSSGDQFSSLTTITQQVRPETFTNYEAGAKWDIRRGLQFTLAAYRLDRTNTRSVDPNDSTRIIQTGSQRTNGIELGFSGSLTRKWDLTGGYAYQDAFITSATASAAAGRQVAQVPHHNFSVWNKYQVTKRFAAGLGVIRRTDMFAGIDNTVILPGYTRADAAVYYTFNERWRVQANIENLFDTRYYLNADSNTNISPGSPRAAKVSLTARF